MLDLYDRLTRLAQEEKKTPDDSLPDPSDVGFSASESDWMYELWTIWRALGKPSDVSKLVEELATGHGALISGLLQMESLYGRIQQQLKNQEPKK